MPQVGLVCPDGKEVVFDECLSSCNNRCMPYPIIYAMIDLELKSYHVGHKITATSILGCIRRTFLERTHNFYNSLANMYYAFRGTVMHNALEALKGDMRWSLEKRYSVSIGGIEISGQIDAYNIKDRELMDYKTTKDKSAQYILANGPKKDHVMQANIYRYIMKKQNPPISVDTATIVYLTMDGVYQCPNITIYDEEMVENFILTNGRELQTAFVNNAIPSMPKKPPMWLCMEYCAVREVCKTLEK